MNNNLFYVIFVGTTKQTQLNRSYESYLKKWQAQPE